MDVLYRSDSPKSAAIGNTPTLPSLTTTALTIVPTTAPRNVPTTRRPGIRKNQTSRSRRSRRTSGSLPLPPPRPPPPRRITVSPVALRKHSGRTASSSPKSGNAALTISSASVVASLVTLSTTAPAPRSPNRKVGPLLFRLPPLIPPLPRRRWEKRKQPSVTLTIGGLR